MLPMNEQQGVFEHAPPGTTAFVACLGAGGGGGGGRGGFGGECVGLGRG
jgi:hypothetical protein